MKDLSNLNYHEIEDLYINLNQEIKERIKNIVKNKGNNLPVSNEKESLNFDFENSRWTINRIDVEKDEVILVVVNAEYEEINEEVGEQEISLSSINSTEELITIYSGIM